LKPNEWGMPTVAIVDGVKIQFFYQDHPPPHFHARIGDESAVIALGLYDVLAGSLPPNKLSTVIE